MQVFTDQLTALMAQRISELGSEDTRRMGEELRQDTIATAREIEKIWRNGFADLALVRSGAALIDASDRLVTTKNSLLAQWRRLSAAELQLLRIPTPRELAVLKSTFLYREKEFVPMSELDARDGGTLVASLVAKGLLKCGDSGTAILSEDGRALVLRQRNLLLRGLQQIASASQTTTVGLCRFCLGLVATAWAIWALTAMGVMPGACAC